MKADIPTLRKPDILTLQRHCSQIPCVEGRRSIRMREQEGQIGNSCSVRKYGCWRLTGGWGKQRIDGAMPQRPGPPALNYHPNK